jgi:hypothetical protein
MKNLFIGVQANLQPIAPSLSDYLDSQQPWEKCIVRAPLGLHLDKQRPLQFTDVLTADLTHLDDVDWEGVTVFIGSPYLVAESAWPVIAQVISKWQQVGVRSICFEDMREWDAQFDFAYECCRIAGINVMVEGIPNNDTPFGGIGGIDILLSAQRYVNHYRRGNLSEYYEYNVIIRRDSLKFGGVYRGLFGKTPETLDELQTLIEGTGANVYRYPSAKKEETTIDTETKIGESVGVVSKATSNTDSSGKPA